MAIQEALQKMLDEHRGDLGTDNDALADLILEINRVYYPYPGDPGDAPRRPNAHGDTPVTVARELRVYTLDTFQTVFKRHQLHDLWEKLLDAQAF